jgi:peptide-methionine (R)-S-oxide reductase
MKRAVGTVMFLLISFSLATASRPAMAQSQDPFAIGRDADSKDVATKTSAGKVKEPERVFKTNEEWQRILTADQFMVTRLKATETPFSGKYSRGHFRGTFLCVCCGARLFDSRHKFESGTGWPSFSRPVTDRVLDTAWDYSEPEARVEVTCRRCGAHLGHVFQDGPPPTGLRFCINSIALKLDTDKNAAVPARKTSRARTAKSSKSAGSPNSNSAARPAPNAAENAAPRS